MANVTTFRKTTDLATNRMDVPFDKKIALLQPSVAPITRLTRMLKVKPVDDPLFKWNEDDLVAKSTTATTADSAASTAIPVTDATIYRYNDIVKVPTTGEVMLVTTDGSGTTLSVSRSLGSTPADSIANGAELWTVGNLNQEGAGLRTLLSTQATEKRQNTQILRTPFGTSNTTKAAKMVDEPDFAYQMKKAGIQHARDIEFSTLFGEGYNSTTGIRGMYGILETISTNVTSLASPGYLTETVFEDWLRDVFRYGSQTRYVFASSLVMSIISGFAKSKLQINSVDQKKYGMAITDYLTPQGRVKLIEHKELEGDYNGCCIGLDFGSNNEGINSAIYWRPLRTRDTKLLTNRQDPDEDRTVHEYLTEGAIQLKEEKRHGILKGILA